MCLCINLQNDILVDLVLKYFKWLINNNVLDVKCSILKLTYVLSTFIVYTCTGIHCNILPHFKMEVKTNICPKY